LALAVKTRQFDGCNNDKRPASAAAIDRIANRRMARDTATLVVGIDIVRRSPLRATAKFASEQ
jgi:hypothetical protein